AYFGKDDLHRFGILTGVYERMLYVLLEVRDEHPLFDAAGTNTLDPATFGDRVWLGFEDSGGEQHQVFLAATGPGSVTARRIETGEYGQQNAPIEPRIHGAWQLTGHGYTIELRVPMSMLGNGFGVLMDDRDARGVDPVSYGTPGPGAGARGRTRAGVGTRLRSPDTRAALPALRRPPRRAAAARIPGPHLRPRPQDAHRPARGHADGDRLDPPARPRPDAHAQLHPQHQRRGGDGDVRVRRVAGGAPLAAAAGERIGPDALWLGHQLSRNRLARRAGRCRAQLLDAPAAPQRVHQLPAHPRRQAGARDPHPAHHRALLAR